MTNPDYRALCAELLDEAIYLGSVPSAFPPSPELVARARALLAEPVERPRELQWPASVAQGCHEAAAEAEIGSPLQQLLVAAGDLLERVRPAAAPTPCPPRGTND